MVWSQTLPSVEEKEFEVGWNRLKHLFWDLGVPHLQFVMLTPINLRLRHLFFKREYTS